MKRAVLVQIVKKLKSNPGFRRKFKIALVVGLIGCVSIFGLVGWATYSLVTQATSIITQIGDSPNTQRQIKEVTAGFGELEFRPLECWGKAQSLIGLQPWLEKPALAQLRSLQMACLGQEPEAHQEVEPADISLI